MSQGCGTVRTIFWWERDEMERTTITGARCLSWVFVGMIISRGGPKSIQLRSQSILRNLWHGSADSPSMGMKWVFKGHTFCWSACAESRVIQCRWIKPREWSLKLKRCKFVLRIWLTSTWSFRSQGMLLSRSRRVSLVCGVYWLLFGSRLLHASSVDASAGIRGRYYLLKSNGHRISISYKVLSRLQSPLYGNSAKLTDAFVWALWENALRRTQISLKFRER